MFDTFNITNSSEHPTRPGHTVYRFYEKKRADYFEKLLVEDNIWHESDQQTETNRTVYFFGIKNRDRKTVDNINYLVNGKFRNRLISNPILKWTFPIITFIIVTLALIGYLKSKA